MKKILLVLFSIINIGLFANEKEVSITIDTGKHWKQKTPYFIKTRPTFAVWIEDLNGNFIETIYVTSKIADQSWSGGKDIERPEALPYWVSKRGSLPTRETPVLDGISGATPKKSAVIKKTYNTGLTEFIVKAEINNSFDYNDYYKKGNELTGLNGQPSILYKVKINLEKQNIFDLVYDGYTVYDKGKVKKVEGKNTLSTALEIVDMIQITF